MAKVDLDVTGFDSMIAMLGRAGLVARKGDMLRWTGPTHLAGARS